MFETLSNPELGFRQFLFPQQERQVLHRQNPLERHGCVKELDYFAQYGASSCLIITLPSALEITGYVGSQVD